MTIHIHHLIPKHLGRKEIALCHFMNWNKNA